MRKEVIPVENRFVKYVISNMMSINLLTCSVLCKFLFNRFNILVVFIMITFLSYSQNNLTPTEIKTIQDQAITLVEYFEIELNTIADPTISNSTINDLIFNSYSGANKIFESSNVIIENNLNPQVIDRSSGKEIDDFNIAKYLDDFNLFMKKEIPDIISFSNITVGPVIAKKDIFVNVYYKSKIIGVQAETDIPYKTVNRKALVKAKKIGNSWRCFIAGISFCEPFLTISDNKVEKEYSSFTEILYPDHTELKFDDRTEKIYYDYTEIGYFDKSITLREKNIKIENQQDDYSFDDKHDSILVKRADHLNIGIDKKSFNLAYINSIKTTYISHDFVDIKFDNDKSTTVYNNKTETKYKGSVKTTYYSQPDENMVLVHGGTFQMGTLEDD